MPWDEGRGRRCGNNRGQGLVVVTRLGDALGTSGLDALGLLDNALLAAAQIDEQRRGQEDRGQRSRNHADEQGQRNVPQVPAPRMKAPTTSSEATGSTPTTEVLIERMKVWLTARLASSAYVERVCAS